MGKKTPSKTTLNLQCNLSPVILNQSPAAKSPQRNLTGPPRVIRDLIADLYNNIQSWNNLHVKGCSIVKEISNLKLNESRIYTTSLENFSTQLFTVVEGLKKNYELFEILETQTESFPKLNNINNPVFFSLSATNLSKIIRDVIAAYKKEFQAKLIILENIAHTKNSNEAMFFAAYWTHQLNIDDKIMRKLESLLLESGHRKIQ